MSMGKRNLSTTAFVAVGVCLLTGTLLVAIGSTIARSSIYGPMLRIVERPALLGLFAVASFGAALAAGWWVAGTRPVTRRRALTSALRAGSAFVLVAAVLFAAAAYALLPADDGTGEMLRDGGWFAVIVYGGAATVVAALVLTAGWHGWAVKRQ